jgi:hypothetical protein
MEIVFRFPTEKQKFSAPEAHGSGREKGKKKFGAPREGTFGSCGKRLKPFEIQFLD